MIAFVGANPENGGVRKSRWTARGKGKHGGLRVNYYFHSEAFPIFLLTVYPESGALGPPIWGWKGCSMRFRAPFGTLRLSLNLTFG